MLNRLFSTIRRYTDASINFLFPLYCLGCQTPKSYLCENCIATIESPQQNLPSWIHPLFSYKNKLIRKSIWLLKYKGIYGIGKMYGLYLYDILLEDFAEKLVTKNTIVIPIPLGSKRQRERGYNQALLVAKGIISHDETSCLKLETNILKRYNTDTRQSHLKQKKLRLQNTSGNFYIQSPEKIAGKNIILIDDVVTTGATLREARKILQQAGARKVTAYTIAH